MSPLAYNRRVRPPDETVRSLQLEPIGVVHSPSSSKVDAARQPAAAADARGTIELFPGRNFEHALEDLEGWEYVWVLFWFHHNESWRPKVLPPRSTGRRRGVFATRSPHRPNPIGLSAVRLERVEGLTLHVAGVDMLDGTPVLDIKPYVAYSDAHPGARSGWLEDTVPSRDGVAPPDPVSGFAVTFEPLAAQQAAWIEARTGLAIRGRIVRTLTLGPQPHPYRRIKRDDDGLRLAVKDWRVRFAVTGREVRVSAILSGYRTAQLAGRGTLGRDTLAAHRDFVAAFPVPARSPADPGDGSPHAA